MPQEEKRTGPLSYEEEAEWRASGHYPRLFAVIDSAREGREQAFAIADVFIRERDAAHAKVAVLTAALTQLVAGATEDATTRLAARVRAVEVLEALTEKP